MTERKEEIKIEIRLSGETGGNPVRARRRKAHRYRVSYLKPQIRDRSLEFSEKAGKRSAESKYPDAPILLAVTASAGLHEEIKSKEITSMKMKHSGKRFPVIFCMALIVAMALTVSGCSKQGKEQDKGSVQTDAQTLQTGEGQDKADQTGGNVVGEGSNIFMLTVVDKDGTESQFEVHTDKETVGEALLEAGLIDGEESEFGLYVKTVNGITADYDEDGVYWAFYVNGEYASSGVDTTPITEGDSYSFKVE